MTTYDEYQDRKPLDGKYRRELRKIFTRDPFHDPKDAMIEASQKVWGDLGDPGLDHCYAGVYFVACGPHIKIGKAGNHPYERMEEFNTGNPYPLELLHVTAIDDEAERSAREGKFTGTSPTYACPASASGSMLIPN